MTERKFTDEEVVKGLECCRKDNVKDCDACPYVDIDTKTYCVNEMIKDALELINRKNAEIERLQKENVFHRKTITENAQRALEVLVDEINKAKTEAIKEFAEEFKKRCIRKGFYPVWIKNILADLVKEKTEGNDE
jgi:hypothetical protein